MLILGHRAQDKIIPGRFGVELDVRSNWNGWLTLCHDPVTTGTSALLMDDWIRMDADANGRLRPLYALNVKEDDIEQQILDCLYRHGIVDRSFVFDMSYPSFRKFRDLGVQVAERISEEEFFQERSEILWVDRWNWDQPIRYGRHLPPPGYKIDGDYIWIPHFSQNKNVIAYVISPELHIEIASHAVKLYWTDFHKMHLDGICTDRWDECEEWLNGMEGKDDFDSKKEG